MYKRLVAVACASILFAGCASVPLEDDATTNQAKAFNPPSKGHAGLYIYRSGALGGALKKDVWVDGECVGETAPDVFFIKKWPVIKPIRFQLNQSFLRMYYRWQQRVVKTTLLNNILNWVYLSAVPVWKK